MADFKEFVRKAKDDRQCASLETRQYAALSYMLMGALAKHDPYRMASYTWDEYLTDADEFLQRWSPEQKLDEATQTMIDVFVDQYDDVQMDVMTRALLKAVVEDFYEMAAAVFQLRSDAPEQFHILVS